jgi:L-glyceraldehyde 3-phosphate reductase
MNELAVKRDQTLAQMALAWILKDKRVTSVLIGVSKPEQVSDSLQCFRNTWFTEDEIQTIDRILK